jgi:hypothetical protein
MALSASTNWSMTAGDVISAALRLMGVGLNGETVTTAETNDTLEALEGLLKLYSVLGLKLWMRRNESITLVASDGDMSLGPSGDVTMDRPVDVLDSYLRDSNNIDIPVTVMSREEYRALTDKTSTGTPNQIHYDPQLTNGVLYIWPVPDSTAASEYTLELNYIKPLDDADATTNDVEIPQEWFLALKWNLAKEIMMEYDIPEEKQKRIEKYANFYRKQAERTDIEDNRSIYIRPSGRLSNG